MSAGGPVRTDPYTVPWEFAEDKPNFWGAAESSMLVVWCVPDGTTALRSDLTQSRKLVQAAARCVYFVLAPPSRPGVFTRYQVKPKSETLILTESDGTEIKRLTAPPGQSLRRSDVEKLVGDEVASREKKLEAIMKVAEQKAKAGDKSAADEYKKVWKARCISPSAAKKAAKELQKLGVKLDDVAAIPLGSDSLADSDIYDAHPQVEELLKSGVDAEVAGSFRLAEGYYRQAVDIDPADTTALRYLGELYRHQTGEWDKAGKVFQQILQQPADPISRAVALHGLGKMTIHSGAYSAGLALFERSLRAFPLPITYRNLAVYWFSESQNEKAAGYMRQALALDPDDTYNRIFAAVYLAAAGKKDEARKIAEANESVLEASYNLAAVWAQIGDRNKAMEMLKRHFYQYESYDAVRAMEMKEARDDNVFASIHQDPQFRELTKLARSAYKVGAEFCSPEALLAQPEYAGPPMRAVQ
jgi:tetratricopeptide (TPR) repeat protein